MNTKLANQLSNLPDTPDGVDPLKRYFVPIEQPTSDGRTVFRTLDHDMYERRKNGQIINHSRVRGGKAHKKARRQARQQAAHANA